MKVKEFIKWLSEFNPNADIFVSMDEELNTIYKDVQIAYMVKEEGVVIWGRAIWEAR